MTDTGGPAFPVTYELTPNGVPGSFVERGMTLRDYYMGQVVPAMVIQTGDKHFWLDEVIEKSNMVVDRMIAERSK